MSLYHFDYQKEIVARDVLKNPYIQALQNKLPKVTFEKMVRILSDQIALTRPSQSSALTFAMLATLVGHNSTCPTLDSSYVWEKVWAGASAHPKTANLMLGALAQYCFAHDERDWLAAKRYTGKTNEDDEEIYVTIYWVKPDAVVLQKKHFSICDLKTKWGHATA